MNQRLMTVSRALDYRFRQPDLLEEALTHSSACPVRGNRTGGAGQVTESGKFRVAYERLEFLGDRVLGLAVADMLFQHFPDENEGALARRHAALVRREALGPGCGHLGIGPCAHHVEGRRGKRRPANPAMLADSCEAVLGAVYADGGLEVAATIIRRHWEPLMAEAATPPKDAKTALQEWAQGRGKALPLYEVLGIEGPQHDPLFLVSVMVEGYPPVTGRGASKRVAEQAAAAALMENVKK